jgi:hypothetical protein
LAYIRQHYGNPVMAYRRWLSRSPHWYRGGGRVGFQAGGFVNSPGLNPAAATRFTTAAAGATAGLGGLLGGLEQGGVGAAATQQARSALRAIYNRASVEFQHGQITLLDRQATQIANEIRALQRGGTTQKERVEIQRLRAGLSAIDFNIGRYIGQKLQQVQDIGTQLQRTLDARLRARRVAGIDAGSVEGIQAGIGDLTLQRTGQREELTRLNQALAQARRRGDADTVRQITDEITQIKDAIDETTTQIIEQQRAAVEAAAQHAITMAQHGVTMATGTGSLQDSISNLAQYIGVSAANAAAAALGLTTATGAIAGSPDALRQQAANLTSNVIPALQKQLAAQRNLLGLYGAATGTRVTPSQAGTPILVGEGGHPEYVLTTDPTQSRRTASLLTSFLRETGRAFAVGGRASVDEVFYGQIAPSLVVRSAGGNYTAGAPATTPPPLAPTTTTTTQEAVAQMQEALQQTQQQILDAMAQAAQLLRQAAEQAAQSLVDAATHTETMANYGLQALQLREQLSGTFDTTAGGMERQAYINTQIIPALQQELAALQNQLAVAQQQNDAALATQTEESIAAKNNEILQASLDAQNQIAQNTADLLREFGGSTGFQFGGQDFTDLLSTGVGV